MKLRKLLVIFLSAIICTSLRGANPVESSAREAVEKLFGNIGAQLSLLSAVQIDTDIETLSPEGGAKHSISYITDGPRYRYSITQFASKQAPTDSKTVIAFDGHFGQSLTQNSGRLRITKNGRIVDGLLINKWGSLEPFTFFHASRGTLESRAALVYPTLQELKDPSLWIGEAKAIVGTEMGEVNGAESVCVTLPGGIIQGRALDSVFKVYFSPGKTFCPVKWERTTTDGSYRQVYEVTQLEEISVEDGKTIKLPKEAVLLGYYNGSSEPYYKSTIRSSVRVLKDIEDDIFTIDPASATNVYDLDEGMVIPVPK